MVKQAGFERRLSKVRELLVLHDVDALLLTNFEEERGVNIQYLSGFTGSSGACFLTREEQILLTDNRYALQAPQEANGWDIRLGSFEEFIGSFKERRIGLIEGEVSWKMARMLQKSLEACEIIPLPNIVEEIRAVKDALEIEAIRTAIMTMEAVLRELYGLVKAGQTTDCELATELKKRLIDRGCGIAFAPIILSGAHSAFIHGDPFKLRKELGYDKVIERGDIIQFDVGCRVDGYVSDISRVAVAGKATEKQKRMHEAIRRAISESVMLYLPGVQGNLAQERANEILQEYGFPDVPHMLGHGIGMEVHEEPYTRSGSLFEDGNVMSNEPGIYEEGYGGMRIERDVPITENGLVFLDELTTDLLELS